MDDTAPTGLRLPQLPKLDKRDIEAVRGFLPGKLLGRIAALLSLVLVVLTFAGAIDRALFWGLGIDLKTMPWLRGGLLVGLPALAVAWQAVLEWRVSSQRRRMRDLAVQPSQVPDGYFRIGPYLDTEADRARFDRADGAHRKVLEWIKHASSLPLYLTGDSGAGKSSLLNAFVLPHLRGAGWMVVEARAWQDPEAALRDALLALPAARRPRAGELPSVRALIEAAVRRGGAGLLLVLDQFEEFVILGAEEPRARFVALLDSLRAEPVPGVRLLLALRSDYESRIEECGLPLFRQGDNHIPVGRFTLTAANAFMAHSKLGLSAEQLDRLLTSAAALDETPGQIRPITLNVLGTVLSTGQPTASSLDAGSLIRRYIEQTLAQPVLRDQAPAVLEELITGFGTKRPMAEPDLVRATKLRRGEIRAVLNGLAAAGLARPLDGEQAAWELSHDFIARAVGRQLGRRRREVLRHFAAYAAPALLAVTVAGAGLTVGWHRFSPYQLRTELAELGLTVTIEADRAAVETNSHFSAERFAAAAPLLARLNAIAPIRSLNLANTQVANLEPLKGLTALTTLDLAITKVANLEPLRGLTALTALGLAITKVANLEPLRGLTALTTLNLTDTEVANLEPLKGLTALTTLNLSRTQVANLEPLKGLTALTALNLSNTQVANLGPLKGLTALTTLNLSNTQVANLEPLKGLTALTALGLAITKVANLEPLKGLTVLTTLDLTRTQVANLEPLKDLTALTTLDLSSTQVANLEPLKGLTALTTLNLFFTQVANLEPLKGLTALMTLNLANTQVANLEPLKGLTALTTLDLSRTQVANLEPLKGLTALTTLNLSNTQVANLEPLEDLPKVWLDGFRATLPESVTQQERDRFAAYRASKGLPPAFAR